MGDGLSEDRDESPCGWCRSGHRPSSRVSCIWLGTSGNPQRVVALPGCGNPCAAGPVRPKRGGGSRPSASARHTWCSPRHQDQADPSLRDDRRLRIGHWGPRVHM